ncbi:MAG: hypothetical protein QGG71_25525 [Pirellulaceae bacterium]|jgi:hypothetical protein|nr:hypothetical protein [Pirellulaceae bacterium]
MDKCLIENDDCSLKTDQLRRGLCMAHYQQFRRQWLEIPADQRQNFEEWLIARGQLAANRQGQGKKGNVFADAATEFAAEQADKDRVAGGTVKAMDKAAGRKKRSPRPKKKT